MKRYWIDVFEPRTGQPEAILKHRRDIFAADEQTAIEQAKQMYRKFVADVRLEAFSSITASNLYMST